MSAKKQDPIRIEQFNYDLPDERIAKYPLAQRDESKLLLWRGGEISEDKFSSIAHYLPENSLLIYNNTRVIQARILFRKPTGARIEVFCLEPEEPADYALSLGATDHCEWKCMVGNLKKWKQVDLTRQLELQGEKVLLTARLIESSEHGHRVRFSWDKAETSFSEILQEVGELPIPPYLHRATEENDKTTYQTVYSRIEGSVAAPTAGLHFTPAVLESLKTRNIKTDELTLHVGAGTFQPVKSELVEEHSMHTETFYVKRETLRALLQAPGPVIAVGTTSVRTLESLYYIGRQLAEAEQLFFERELIFKVTQWEPYEEREREISLEEALKAVHQYLERVDQEGLHGETQILIKPGFQFRLIKGIITNFHQPQSTLLLLVSAFVEGDWERIYDYAMSKGFRFLSYGDSSLLLKE